MADIDMERAKRLLKCAKTLFNEEDLYGVAELTKLAFGSATIALTARINGRDPKKHLSGTRRAKEIVSKLKDRMDFYGNARQGGEKREITPEEVKEALDVVEEYIKEAEKILKQESFDRALKK
jgi:uncharacterized protein (UPF0332 family)